MAYSRTPDVFLYADGDRIVCHACRLWWGPHGTLAGRDLRFTHRSTVLAHLARHATAGHAVDAGAAPRLRDEAARLGDAYTHPSPSPDAA